MPTRKTRTSKPHIPMKYVIMAGLNEDSYALAKGNSESGAETKAAKLLQPSRYHAGHAMVGIYRLIKVVRRKEAPVEIEEIACCDEA
jgi:hypothetical protein